MTALSPLTIPGDFGEGGGETLRLAAALSTLTGRTIRIDRIRANRPNPGLREQHLQALRALSTLSEGRLEGASIGSTEVEFVPGGGRRSRLRIRIGTAGSVSLLLQAVLLPCFFAPGGVQVEIEGGGTYVAWSPTIHYLEHVLLPTLSRMGFRAKLQTHRQGFYPKGGAAVSVAVKPVETLETLRLEERGKLQGVRGIALASQELRRGEVAERMARSLRQVLHEGLGLAASVEKTYVETAGAGAGVTVWSEYEKTVLGWDALGERGKPAEKVGQAAAQGLLRQMESGATVDEYASDQLLPYMAVCPGTSTFRTTRLTSHATTAIWLIEQFLPARFSAEDGLLRCSSEGFRR